MAKAQHGQEQDLGGQNWFNSAVLYEVDIKNFRDSNGDGIGDIQGLIDGLDYIASLNVQCLWLQPFYQTPNRDNGYDISEYRVVNPALGTMDDFDRLIAEATKRDLRVIADLPLNHVSDQHHWFQAARKDRQSPYRNYFVWVDEEPEKHDPYPVFGPEQDGNWNFDEEAGQFYFHTFYKFMPDLNYGSKQVEQELLDVARFWMKRGLSGFRLDAVPFMIHDTSDQEKLEMPHKFLEMLNKAVIEVQPDALLMAEANLKPNDMCPFFGNGDQMHMLLNFYLCNHIILAVATAKAEHIRRAWDELPEIPKNCNWANFIRNHDELSLDQLTKEEQQQCFDAFAPDDDMRLYDRGIRRRLAPMLNGDLARIKLTYSLLLSLPGTPVINLGEEIGLGDDLTLKDREAGRTPMQWNNQQNGGFSTAPRDKLIRPVVMKGRIVMKK
jgi:maltose alpha-D-glucosyltransferase/alpha-amylase